MLAWWSFDLYVFLTFLDRERATLYTRLTSFMLTTVVCYWRRWSNFGRRMWRKEEGKSWCVQREVRRPVVLGSSSVQETPWSRSGKYYLDQTQRQHYDLDSLLDVGPVRLATGWAGQV